MTKRICVYMILSLVLLTGCAVSVVDWGIKMQSPVPAETAAYSDEDIDVNFMVNDKSINFDLKNKTQNGIKLNYDEMSYISPGGVSLRIVSSNIRFTDRFAPQAPVVVPPGLSISETIIPAQNIFFRANDIAYYGWDVGPLFPNDAKTYLGQEFGLYFPMEIKGAKKEFIFKFVITSVEKKK
ncbi:MAG: hypothetical protein PHD29_03235 [bacterium]|nr:hypothetical protein [bacterium]MDD5756376.1 hypothetical protein [bacterium]